MYQFDKYARPYCTTCKLLWGKQSIGTVLNCTKCGRRLVLKSFNPYAQCAKGLGIMSLGGLSMILGFPIIWIGGFLWGGQLIFHAFKQWGDVKALDNKTR